MNGLYYQLDELRELYGVESIKEIVGGIINQRRLNRPVELLQSKTIVTAEEHEENQMILRQFRRYVCNLAREKAQKCATNAKNGTAMGCPRT